MRSRIRRLITIGAAAALATGASFVVLGGTAGAATFTVTNTADDGSASSLRDVIENQATTDGDVVVLTAGATYTLLDPPCSDLDVGAEITIRSSSTTQNATIVQTCDDEEVIDVDSGDLIVENVDITGGNDDGDGGGIGASGDLTLIRSRVYGNATSTDGGGLAVAGNATIIASTIDSNCAEDDGGGGDFDGDVILVNSTVTANTSDDQGAIDLDEGGLTLVYSDVVANTLTDGVDCGAPNPEPEARAEPGEISASTDADEVEPADTNEPSNIGYSSGGISSFGSVVALPLVGAGVDPFTVPPFNCGNDDGGATTSSGYNFSDDDTCGFTNVAAGDRQNAGNPGLGALAANGGPTPTLLPAATSPLVNFIPIAACAGGDALAGSAVTTDQRGIARPRETGCEIGSVEIEGLVVRFTG